MRLKAKINNNKTYNNRSIYSEIGDFYKYSVSDMPREEKLWRCYISNSRKRYKRIMIEKNLIIPIDF